MNNMKEIIIKILISILILVVVLIFASVMFIVIPIILLFFVLWRIIRLTFFTSKQQREVEINGVPFTTQAEEDTTTYIGNDIIDVEASIVDEKEINT